MAAGLVEPRRRHFAPRLQVQRSRLGAAGGSADRPDWRTGRPSRSPSHRRGARQSPGRPGPSAPRTAVRRPARVLSDRTSDGTLDSRARTTVVLRSTRQSRTGTPPNPARSGGRTRHPQHPGPRAASVCGALRVRSRLRLAPRQRPGLHQVGLWNRPSGAGVTERRRRQRTTGAAVHGLGQAVRRRRHGLRLAPPSAQICGVCCSTFGAGHCRCRRRTVGSAADHPHCGRCLSDSPGRRSRDPQPRFLIRRPMAPMVDAMDPARREPGASDAFARSRRSGGYPGLRRGPRPRRRHLGPHYRSGPGRDPKRRRRPTVAEAATTSSTTRTQRVDRACHIRTHRERAHPVPGTV